MVDLIIDLGNLLIHIRNHDKISERLIKGLYSVETDTNQGSNPLHLNETITSAMRGEVPAFGVLYFHFGYPIYNYIFAQVNDPLLAQDLTEEAFFRAWNDLSDFKIAQDFQVYLLQHARQAVARYFKENPAHSPGKTPLGSLPSYLAEILILHDVLELPFQKIGQILAIPSWVAKPIHGIGLKRLAEIPEVAPRGNQESADWIRPLLPRPIFSQAFLVRGMHRLVALLQAAQIQQKVRLWDQQQQQRLKKEKIYRSKLSFRALSTIVVVIALLFSSTGVVDAAHSSIPGDSLYPAKLTLEDLRLTLTASQDNQIILHTQFSHRRLDEITSLIEMGQYSLLSIPIKNLEGHLVVIGTYTLAAAIDEPVILQEINLLLLRVEGQFEILETIQSNLPEPTRTLVTKTITTYQENFKVNPIFSEQPAGEIDNFWQPTEPAAGDPLTSPAATETDQPEAIQAVDDLTDTAVPKDQNYEDDLDAERPGRASDVEDDPGKDVDNDEDQDADADLPNVVPNGDDDTNGKPDTKNSEEPRSKLRGIF